MSSSIWLVKFCGPDASGVVTLCCTCVRSPVQWNVAHYTFSDLNGSSTECPLSSQVLEESEKREDILEPVEEPLQELEPPQPLSELDIPASPTEQHSTDEIRLLPSRPIAV